MDSWGTGTRVSGLGGELGGRIAIVDGRRGLFDKNSGRDPSQAQLLDSPAAAEYPRGTRLRCPWIEIDQVERSNAVLFSRPWWMWGAEMGANEHGVVIGNQAVFTRQPYARAGLTGMNLLRLALERADAAERAVAIIVDLLEQRAPAARADLANAATRDPAGLCRARARAGQVG